MHLPAGPRFQPKRWKPAGRLQRYPGPGRSRPARTSQLACTPPKPTQDFPIFACSERRLSTRVNSAPALLTCWPSSSNFACSVAPCTAQARLTAPHACTRTGCPTSPEGVDPAEFALSAAFTRAALVPSNACTSTSKSDTGATLPKNRTPQETENRSSKRQCGRSFIHQM